MSILQKILNKFKTKEVDFDVKRVTSDLFDSSHQEKRPEANVYSCSPEFEVKCIEKELKEVIQGMMINFFEWKILV